MTDGTIPTTMCATSGVCAVSRRAVTGAAGAAVIGLLAACAPSGDDESPILEGATAEGPLATVPLDDIPVGGGHIVSEVPLVITRPSDDEVRSFSGVCTHQGCAVGQVTQRGIICPCHTSIFSIDDGSVLAGPAPEPLPALAATIEGDHVVVTLPSS